MNQRVLTIAGSSLVVLAVGLGVYFLTGTGGNPSTNPGPKDSGPGPEKKDTTPVVRDGQNNTTPTDPAWLERIVSPDPATRRTALGQFDQHKGEVTKAIPVLLGKLSEKDPATRSALSDLLAKLGKDDGPGGKIGAEAVRLGLVTALTKEDAAGKTVAALTLGKIGEKNDAALSGLQKGVLDSDKELQRVAALVLGKLASDGGLTLPEGLDDRSFAGKWLRFVSQGAISSEDTPLVGPLALALQDPDPALQLWAAKFFAGLGDTIRTSPEAIPALTQVFKGNHDEAALAAARALGKLALRESSLAATLVMALGDGDATLRKRAVAALVAAQRPLEGRPGKMQVPAGLQTPQAIATLAKALEDDNPEVRAQVIRVLAAIGAPAAKAVPALVKVAGSNVPTDKAQRLEAFRALGAIAQDSATVVPLLLKSLKDADPEIKKAAGSALASYGKEAIPGLRKVVGEEDPAILEDALLTLGAIGPEAKEALAEVTPLLKSTQPQVRIQAAAAIQRIDPTNKDFLPVLKNALAEKEPALRQVALDAIKQVGPGAVALVPELAKALEDEDRNVAWRAADALAAIGPGAVKATEALAAVIKKCPDSKRNQEQVFLDSPEYVTQRAIDALRAIGPDAKAAAPALVAVLEKVKDLEAADTLSVLDPTRSEGLATLIENARSSVSNFSETALRAIGRLGVTAKPAVPALIERLSGDASLSSPVKEALIRLGPVAVPALIQALADRGQRLGALEVLSKIGPQAKEAAPAMLKASEAELTSAGLLAIAGLGEAGAKTLLEAVKDRTRAGPALKALATLEGQAAPVAKSLADLLKEKNFEEKAELLRTLAALGPAAKGAVPLVKEQLTAGSEEVQAAAGLALVKIGDDKTAAPVLLRVLKEAKHRDARRDAARGLGLLPGEAKESLPLLQGLLKDPDFELRVAAAGAIANLDKEGVKGIPALIEALTDREVAVQVAVCQALAKFGKEAKEAIPALQARLKDRDQVQLATIEALGKLGPVARDATPALRELLQTQDETGLLATEMPTALARALWRIEGKAAAREILPVLSRQLNPRAYDKAQADTIEAISELGAEAAPLIPALTQSLDSTYQSVRRASATALGKIGPAAKPALPWLQRAVTQEADEELRRKAREASAAIQKS
jgi:HEAT repeat protein